MICINREPRLASRTVTSKLSGLPRGQTSVSPHCQEILYSSQREAGSGDSCASGFKIHFPGGTRYECGVENHTPVRDEVKNTQNYATNQPHIFTAWCLIFFLHYKLFLHYLRCTKITNFILFIHLFSYNIELLRITAELETKFRCGVR
jgi:hypothetical protein